MNATEHKHFQNSPSLAVVEAITTADGVQPEALEPPLFEVIDPGALDRLVSHGGTLEKVTFDYRGHCVTVFGDGVIELD